MIPTSTSNTSQILTYSNRKSTIVQTSGEDWERISAVDASPIHEQRDDVVHTENNVEDVLLINTIIILFILLYWLITQWI